jgi:glycosyltransferase involved in cell wall biosynthesis
MKITFVMPTPDWGGGCRVIATYAHRLIQHGHEVVVVYRSPSLTLRNRLSSTLLDIFRTNRNESARSHLDVFNIPQIQLSREHVITDADIPDADVVVATYWETAHEVLALSPRKGAKAYFLQHYEVVFVGADQEKVKETWTYPMRKIVVAPWLKELAESEFGDSSAILVPNGVDTAQFTAPRRRKNRRPTAGFVFSHPGFKGSDIAIEAFELLKKEMPDVRIISFGNSWRRSLKKGPSLPKGTEYMVLPSQARIPEIYGQCDVWVCASRSEGFGLPMLEAMACRTPVVSTPTGIAPLLSEQGGLRLAAHESPRGLADEIQNILELPDDDWAVLSQQAYATAQQYGLETAALQFERALEAVAAQK